MVNHGAICRRNNRVGKGSQFYVIAPRIDSCTIKRLCVFSYGSVHQARLSRRGQLLVVQEVCLEHASVADDLNLISSIQELFPNEIAYARRITDETNPSVHE